MVDFGGENLVTIKDSAGLDYTIDLNRFEVFSVAVQNLNLPGAEAVILVYDTPLTEIVRVRYVSIRYVGTPPTRMGYEVFDAGAEPIIWMIQTITTAKTYTQELDLFLLPADQLQARLSNATAGNDVFLTMYAHRHTLIDS